MDKFIKGQGRDPYLVDPNDYNPGFFGHLNALVAAITALQEGGGSGPGGGNPISVYLGGDERVTNLSKLTFSGNVTVTLGAVGEALITIPPIANGSIGLNKLAVISPGLLGRYTAGTGGVQTITVGNGLNLSTGGVLTSTSSGTVVTGIASQIAVSGPVDAPVVGLSPIRAAASSQALATITVDAYGRVTTSSAGSINQVGLTLASTISIAPTNPNDIANKAYVDNFAQGLKPKASARLATTVNITLSGAQPIDGINAVAGNRILVKNQTAAANNGVYVVVAGGPWTRADDYNSAVEAADGSFVFVREGTTNGGSGFVQITSVTTFGTDSITFAQFSAGGTYTNGTGLGLTAGNQFFLNNTTVAPGSKGSSSLIPSFTVDAQGRLTAASETAVLINLNTATNVGTSILRGVNGGTGLSSYVKGDTIYASATDTLSKLAIGGAGQVLTVSATGVPSWKDAEGGLSNPMDAAGQMIYSTDTAGTPEKVPVAATDGFVLAYNTAANKPEWRAATGSNPTDTRGDIIYTSVTDSPGTLDNLAIGALGQYLRVVDGGSGSRVPSWQNGVTTGTVVSFVIDGYGGPLTGTGGPVFVATIPFAATYTGFTIQADTAPTGANGLNTITLTVGSKTASITGTAATAIGTGINIVFAASGSLTFSLTVTGPSSATTKLFVNLTGTRS